MQHGCEQRTGPPFNTCDGHRLSPPRQEAARPRICEQTCEPGGFRFGHTPAQRRQAIVAATLVIVSWIGSLAQFLDELGFE